MKVDWEVDNCLDVIQEECAELIQVISKIKRFGLFNAHPKHNNIKNFVLMASEYGDLIGSMDKLETLLQDEFIEYEFNSIARQNRVNKGSRIDKFFKLTKELENVKS